MSTFVRFNIEESSHSQRENHSWSPSMEEAYSHGAQEHFRQHHHGGHHHHTDAQYLPVMQIVSPEAAAPQSHCQPAEQQPSPLALNSRDIESLGKAVLDLSAWYKQLTAGSNPSGDASVADATNAAPLAPNDSAVNPTTAASPSDGAVSTADSAAPVASALSSVDAAAPPASTDTTQDPSQGATDASSTASDPTSTTDSWS